MYHFVCYSSPETWLAYSRRPVFLLAVHSLKNMAVAALLQYLKATSIFLGFPNLVLTTLKLIEVSARYDGEMVLALDLL